LDLVRLFPQSPEFAQRRSLVAAVAVGAGISFAPFAFGAMPVDQVAERSITQLPPTIELDNRAKQAFEKRSLPEMKALYEELQTHSETIEDFQKSGGNDGKGRYEPWMLDESINLLESYQGYVLDCAADAKAAPVIPQLTAQLLKAL
jgi:hypothetical protein